MKRRSLLTNVANLLGAGAAAALVPVAEKGAGKKSLPRLEGQKVHWVSPDRRHIEAVLIHRYKDGSADLLIEERPAEGAIHFLQTHPKVRYFENSPAVWEKVGGAPPHTWHEPEPYETIRAAKPYAQWWLRRAETASDRLAPKPELTFAPVPPNSDTPSVVRISKAKDGVIVNSVRYDPDDAQVG